MLHAVIARLAPGVQVIDLSHGIAPFDVVAGAALLARAVPHLGDGVVCAVVDPGVGSARRAVALEVGASPYQLVGPDNGVLMSAAAALGGVRRAVALSVDPPVSTRSATFDGRDVFAPAAARLACGEGLERLGAPLVPSSLVMLEAPPVTTRTLEDGRLVLTGTIQWVDRFGNVQLSVPGRALARATTAGVIVGDNDVIVRVVRAYAELERGAAGLLCDAERLRCPRRA